MNIKEMKQAIKYYNKAYNYNDEHMEFLALSQFMKSLFYDKNKIFNEIETYETLNMRVMLKIYTKLRGNPFYRRIFKHIMK
jgi:hypothetical protein